MKKFAAIVITAILLTVCSLCVAMVFHPPVPETAAGIGALRQKVRVEGALSRLAAPLRRVSP